MNKDRRIKLYEVRNTIEQTIKAIKVISYEEESAFDNLTEGLQQTRRGEQMEENVDTFQTILDLLDDVISNIDDIQ